MFAREDRIDSVGIRKGALHMDSTKEQALFELAIAQARLSRGVGDYEKAVEHYLNALSKGKRLRRKRPLRYSFKVWRIHRELAKIRRMLWKK